MRVDRAFVRRGLAGGILLSGLLVIVLAGCASDRNRQQASFDRSLAALSTAHDADSIAVAAELTDLPDQNNARRLTALNRAVALAPNRPDLVWLQIIACSQIETCDLKPLSTTLHNLDPENGAAWAFLLDRATARGDTNAVSTYLQRMADAQRFDVYWNSSVSHLTAALIKSRAANARAALIAVFGREAALSLPTYETLHKACGPPALGDSVRLSLALHQPLRSFFASDTPRASTLAQKRVQGNSIPGEL